MNVSKKGLAVAVWVAVFGTVLPRAEAQPPSTPPGAAKAASLRADLRLHPARARLGETATLSYTLTNSQAGPRSFSFSSGKQFDIIVRARSGAREVWRLSGDRMYTMALTQITIAPGQTKTFASPWQPNRDLADGTYEVTAFLTPMGSSGEVAPARLLVTVRSGVLTAPAAPSPEKTKPADDEPAPLVGLRSLLADGRTFVGKRVSLRGVYRGRQGGQGGPPTRRSDWVVEAEGRTIYVSGTIPELDAGAPITVAGTVRRTADGRYYLDTHRTP